MELNISRNTTNHVTLKPGIPVLVLTSSLPTLDLLVESLPVMNLNQNFLLLTDHQPYYQPLPGNCKLVRYDNLTTEGYNTTIDKVVAQIEGTQTVLLLVGQQAISDKRLSAIISSLGIYTVAGLHRPVENFGVTKKLLEANGALWSFHEIWVAAIETKTRANQALDADAGYQPWVRLNYPALAPQGRFWVCAVEKSMTYQLLKPALEFVRAFFRIN